MSESRSTLHLRLFDWGLDRVDVWFEDALRVQSAAMSTLNPAELAGYVTGLGDPAHSTVVWLSAPLVLELTTVVPSMSASQLRARIPYAVEESLIADIDAEHFAVGDTTPLASGQHHAPLRVVNAAKLRQLLQQLAELAGITPDAVYSEADALPAKPGDLQLWVEVDSVRLRHPDGRWLLTPATDLDSALRWLVPEGAAEIGLWVLCQRLDRARWEPIIQGSAARFAALRWQVSESPPLTMLSTRIGLRPPINLLQGAFAPRARLPALRLWRWPLALAAAALLMAIALDVALTVRASGQEQAMDAALLEWRTTLEYVGTPGNEPVTPFSVALASAAEVRSRWAGVALQHLEGDSRSLRMTLTGETTLSPPDDLLPALTTITQPLDLGPATLAASDTGWRIAAARTP